MSTHFHPDVEIARAFEGSWERLKAWIVRTWRKIR
jgi:hypothetical protein